MWQRRQSGFTLIELLVVIAIIGTLASVVLASLNSAREKARDSARASQLQQIRTALELFHADNGRYPSEGSPDNANGQICSSCSGNINSILDDYMGAIPQDPSHDGDTYYYYYDGRHICGGYPNIALVFASALESDEDGNAAELKCSSFGGEGSASGSAYRVILGDSYDG